MSAFRFKIKTKTKTYFDDPPAVPPVPVPPPPPPAPRTFTQDEFNAAMAEHKRNLQKQNAELAAQLETFKTKAGLTEQERNDLQARIDQLSTEHLTEAQKLQAAIANNEKKYKTDTERLNSERDSWKSRYNTTLVETAVRAAAATHKAASADQMIGLYGHQAKVVEVLGDDGKGTGQFVVKLPLTVEDPKTKAKVQVELTMDEAFAELKKREENFNLFLDEGSGGAGLLNRNKGGSNTTGWKPDMTPEQYMAFRKASGLKGAK